MTKLTGFAASAFNPSHASPMLDIPTSNPVAICDRMPPLPVRFSLALVIQVLALSRMAWNRPLHRSPAVVMREPMPSRISPTFVLTVVLALSSQVPALSRMAWNRPLHRSPAVLMREPMASRISPTLVPTLSLAWSSQVLDVVAHSLEPAAPPLPGGADAGADGVADLADLGAYGELGLV